MSSLWDTVFQSSLPYTPWIGYAAHCTSYCLSFMMIQVTRASGGPLPDIELWPYSKPEFYFLLSRLPDGVILTVWKTSAKGSYKLLLFTMISRKTVSYQTLSVCF